MLTTVPRFLVKPLPAILSRVTRAAPTLFEHVFGSIPNAKNKRTRPADQRVFVLAVAVI
ncbi:MAG: hypothetical protein ABI939_00250 [Anaerolineaceae bacterium]